MKKSIMKFNVLIFTGLLGLGLMTSPIDAEEGQETRANEKSMSTEVIYESTRVGIDNGDVVLIVPSFFNFNKNRLDITGELSVELLKYNNFNQVGPFSIDVFVKGKNKINGKTSGTLRKNDYQVGQFEAKYGLKNNHPSDATTKMNESWQQENHTIARFPKRPGVASPDDLSKRKLTRSLESWILRESRAELETFKSGTQFSDILTFTVQVSQKFPER